MLIHYKALSLRAAIVTAALSVLAVSPALAQDESLLVTAPRAVDMPTMWVSYRDLNLTYAPARVTLIHRVDYAVRQVCQESDQRAVRTLRSHMDYVSCSNFAWNGARPQLAAAFNRAWARAG
jgi:UrcA family protein